MLFLPTFPSIKRQRIGSNSFSNTHHTRLFLPKLTIWRGNTKMVYIPTTYHILPSFCHFYASSSYLCACKAPETTTMTKYKEYGYDIQNGRAIIPEWATEIEVEAFMNCEELKSITIPPSVTKIWSRAFSGCSSLTSISIPPSVTEIGNWAFSRCKSLTSISIPESVTEIGDYAFNGCKSLTSITIPPSVTEIGISAFSGCSSLTSITVSKDNKVFDSREDCDAIIHTESNTLISGCKNTIIPPSVTKIGVDAFYGCSSLTSITIPESVTKIGGGAFARCSSLTNITIPSSVTEIGGASFAGCSSLTSITIPPSVTEIGLWVFLGCSSLTSITIPPSVTEIDGWAAFNGCSSLTSISVSKDNKVYDSRQDCNAIIHTESNTLIRGCKNTIIPPSVTKIGSSAFGGCSSLTSITIPESYNPQNEAFRLF